MTKHDLTSRADALSMVTKPVTTVSAVSMVEVAKEVATETAVRSPVRTESTVSKSADAGFSRTVSRGHFTQQPAPDAWTDDEVALCESRARVFTTKGIPSDAADLLACRLTLRDRQLDDRRSCAECTGFHKGQCLQRITPIGETSIHTLHRCRGFELNEILHD
jgi:hypothetical protein